MDQAEGIRNVIKRQNQRMVSNHARVITITSGKGGVGKSNVAVYGNSIVEIGKKSYNL